MQRPWGRTMLEEQLGGLCGRNRVSEGEERRRGGERGDGAGGAGPYEPQGLGLLTQGR